MKKYNFFQNILISFFRFSKFPKIMKSKFFQKIQNNSKSILEILKIPQNLPLLIFQNFTIQIFLKLQIYQFQIRKSKIANNMKPFQFFL